MRNAWSAAAVVLFLAARTRTGAEVNGAELAEHLAQLRRQAPAGFTIVAQPPFVVLGDEKPAMVRQRAVKTVRWAVDKLKQDFFPLDPDGIIDIWLFRDRDSYRRHLHDLFNETPDTPFGYYSPKHRALFMNIATGGGTLVHEIVHPYMRANFPACPAWFDEGFASLFEQSAERDGHIRGLVNWRLAGLIADIQEHRTLSFARLTALTKAEFYGAAGGGDYSRHYAQARYLCYYLQERGLLARFYHEFAARVRDDPTGYETLRRIGGAEDMATFQEAWERFVLRLEPARASAP